MKKITSAFEKFSAKVTKITGKPISFLMAMFIVIVWGITGPVFKFSDTWQMVFVIQQSQNKDTIALQLKLNELIAATSTASNRLIDVEDISSEELEVLKKFYIKLAMMAKKDKDIHKTHSIDEAKTLHDKKKK